MGQRHKVLRNTYWLLALSMLPTVLGAWIGVATGITQSLSGGLGLIVFMGGAFRLHVRHRKDQELGSGRARAAGLHLFHGPDAVTPDRHGAGLQERADLIMTAFAGTAGVFFVMASLASVIKRDLSGMGKWLMVGAWC
jgi:modulator of FtsH protease